MLTLPANFTVFVLIMMIGIAFLPPKIPTLLRNILLQFSFAFFLYFAMGDVTFDLPNGDKLPMSGLAGGYMMVGEGIPLFNKYALGFLGLVIGVVFSVLVGIVRFIISRKKGDKSDD